MYLNRSCRCSLNYNGYYFEVIPVTVTVCADFLDADFAAKTKDGLEKKAGQKAPSAKPSKQQECIVCKKVDKQ